MHPTLAEQLAKAIQHDRLTQAEKARLVREAGGRRSVLLQVTAIGEFLLGQIQKRRQNRPVRRETLSVTDAENRSDPHGAPVDLSARRPATDPRKTFGETAVLGGVDFEVKGENGFPASRHGAAPGRASAASRTR